MEDDSVSIQKKDQRFELMKTSLGVSLFLNKQCQFTEADEAIYHEILATLPLVCAQSIEDILICGGGDGLVAREVLRFPVSKVVLCEIDPQIIELTKTNPEMRRLTQNSLNNPLVEIVIDDAYEFVQRCQQKFDVIILDFPSLENYDDPNLTRLFSKKFFDFLKNLSKQNTVIGAQYGAIYGMDILLRLLPLLRQEYRHVHYITAWLAEDRVEEFLFLSNEGLYKRRHIPRQCKFLNDRHIELAFSPATYPNDNFIDLKRFFSYDIWKRGF